MSQYRRTLEEIDDDHLWPRTEEGLGDPDPTASNVIRQSKRSYAAYRQRL